MGLDYPPEVKIARRFSTKNGLGIPFDISKIVSRYATIIYKDIPIEGIDGICLNLKSISKKTKVIINSNSSPARQKFTLAHELGHIIIPWHYGFIIDDIDDIDSLNPSYDSPYWQTEREANLFASEILMPFDYIYSKYKINSDVDYLLNAIIRDCGVSQTAAEIRLKRAFIEIENLLMPKENIIEIYEINKDICATQKHFINSSKLTPLRVAELMARAIPLKLAFCVENDDIVIGSGSKGIYRYHQFVINKFIKKPFAYYSHYTVCKHNNQNTHWWIFENTFVPPQDDRSWREILDTLAQDLAPGNEVKFKASMNGKLSGANGIWKSKDKGTLIEFFNDVVSRFNNPEYKKLLDHPDFITFLWKKCESFYVPKP